MKHQKLMSVALSRFHSVKIQNIRQDVWQNVRQYISH